MNLFSNLRVYGGKWAQKSSRKFSAEEKALVTKAQVVESQYGNSCCFFMANGTTMFVPMSNDAKSEVGDFINLDEAEILTLEKAGEADIQRIRG
ncbi:hypothetical protein [Fusobacterium ulcerans]|jgi:hypothetical protein|uniref:hypothetical protein n=1 Tax=Fusobacterium ulcerans TaxID=861 RepID=UPI002E768DAF|nr:hypothetical protein [Fusobacterium ulcerans]MEE0138337.1 hypothetical protein [Fusobacterium ulcerans]